MIIGEKPYSRSESFVSSRFVTFFIVTILFVIILIQEVIECCDGAAFLTV